MKIKICGLTDRRAVQAAAGADFLGLVFAPSHRQVDQLQARSLSAFAHALRQRPGVVGVFVNTPAAEVNRLAEFCSLDYVQLSGGEDWAYCQKIEWPVIKAVHVSPDARAQDVLAEVERGLALGLPGLVILLDTDFGGKFGGTGQKFGRDIARRVAARFPVMIAGGLDASDVAGYIRDVKPWGVDVSSGVETKGKKDEAKIKEFIIQARSI